MKGGQYINPSLRDGYGAKLTDRLFRIHLLQMSNGRPHPEAANSIITGPAFSPGAHTVGGEVQLTGCRIAARVIVPHGLEHLIVWDWKTGEKYMVCPSQLLLPHDNSILPFGTNRKFWTRTA